MAEYFRIQICQECYKTVFLMSLLSISYQVINFFLPHVLVGDEAYPLKTFLMRPTLKGLQEVMKTFTMNVYHWLDTS